MIAPPLETRSPLGSLPSRFNLRDLGGTPVGDGLIVAPGRLYRGASMHRLEADHLEAVAPLGIRTAIDLRSSEEVGSGTFTGSASPVRHLPIFEVGPSFDEPVEDVVRTLADAYLWMLSEGAGSIRAAIEVLGDPRGTCRRSSTARRVRTGPASSSRSSSGCSGSSARWWRRTTR